MSNQISKLKQDVLTAIDTTKKVVAGAKDLFLSTCLVVVSAYNAYDLTIRPVDQVEYYVRAVASGTILLLGAWAVVKVFKAIGENSEEAEK